MGTKIVAADKQQERQQWKWIGGKPGTTREELENEHAYVLRVGNKYTDQHCSMTGKAALIANGLLLQTFLRALEVNSQTSYRLHEWVKVI